MNADYLAIGCRACGAEQGEQCWKLNTNGSRLEVRIPIKWPHYGRVATAARLKVKMMEASAQKAAVDREVDYYTGQSERFRMALAR